MDIYACLLHKLTRPKTSKHNEAPENDHSVQAGIEPGGGWLLERLIIPAYATGAKTINLLALVQLRG
jgi:hypothetical protein